MKTKAEYQKDYRERKKVNDPNYRAKESRRSKMYRKPAASLGANELESVRERSRERSRKYRQHQKELREKARQNLNIKNESVF